jgi:16S rRNA (uracil1498-N3)-methyltransferase
MALPFFYINEYDAAQKQIVLDEDTSKHIVQVLRMKTGEQLNLTDGKGNLLTCEITDGHKKHCTVVVKETRHKEQGTRKTTIAISLLKNSNRFEWFLEKATEIGVTEIIPLICERTVKERFRQDRMQGIVISAMLQSQQIWIPVLHEPTRFADLPIWKCADGLNFIGHCIDGSKQALSNYQIGTSANRLILIGPEGDFTPKEIELALEYQFIPVSLGETRLRTETAGIVAATLLCHI